MAQPDDFKLIREIVAAGGHKHMVGKLDQAKYQRWLPYIDPELEELANESAVRHRNAAERRFVGRRPATPGRRVLRVIGHFVLSLSHGCFGTSVGDKFC